MTAKLTQSDRDCAARLRSDFARPFDLEYSSAHLCSGNGGRRARRSARRAVDGPRRRPSRADSRPGCPHGAAPRVARSADQARPRAARDRRALQPPGRGDRGGPRRAGRGRGDARRHRASRCATRCRSSRRWPLDRSARALFLFPTKALGQDQVAECNTLAQLAGLDVAAATYDGDTPGADPIGDPDRRPDRRDEPGHAPRGDPAPPYEVVPALRAAPGDRGRRAPHVPGRLRQPRRQRPPAAPPAVCPLRLEAGHRLLLGHDRQSTRAREHPDRTGARADRSQRGAVGRAPRPARRSPAPRRRDRGARVGPDPGQPLGPAVPPRRPPDDCLRPLPDRGRAAPDRAARGAARACRSTLPSAGLSRRLPAHRAALDRAGPAQRRGPRRRQHERPRAGRRHRPPRRGDHRRLSGLGRRRPGSRSAGPAGGAASAWRSSSPAGRRSINT